MNIFNKKLLIPITILIFFGVFLAAQTGLTAYEIEVSIPHGPQSGDEPEFLEYLKGLYMFGLFLLVFLAFVVLTVAGVVFMLSDTISKKDEAKKYIWAAISGLLLGLGAYLILRTINPELIQLKKPDLPSDSSSSSIFKNNNFC